MIKYFLMVTLVMQMNLIGSIPNYWKDFEIKSSNGQFVAKIRKEKGLSHRTQVDRKYKISVYEIKDGKEELYWVRNFIHTGESVGILSNDGNYFAYIDYYYWKNAAVVIIHSKDNFFKIMGEYFGIEKSSMKKVKVKNKKYKLWIKPFLTRDKYPGCRFDIINGKFYLALFTLDDQIRFVDPELGKILEYKDI